MENCDVTSEYQMRELIADLYKVAQALKHQSRVDLAYALERAATEIRKYCEANAEEERKAVMARLRLLVKLVIPRSMSL